MESQAAVGLDRALRIVAENKLRAAIDGGCFANLPGLGKPLPLLDEPYDPYWWIRRKLQREAVAVNPRDGWLENR